MNLRLSLFLAWRSLMRHRAVALATVLGVAIGTTVVGAILIVDRNSIETAIRGPAGPVLPQLAVPARGAPAPVPEARLILRVTFERGAETAAASVPAVIPTQRGAAGEVDVQAPPVRRGEEDYQAMRLAVRLASVLAFAVGAVIVFYTMRFSVASRGRELSLLLCLGESRINVALSLLAEAAMLGLAGTLAGLVLSFPIAGALMQAGISTTGRVPAADAAIPWADLAVMAAAGVATALAGAAAPARGVLRMPIVEVLQPRFAAPDAGPAELATRGFAWLAPPLMAMGWLAVRPFLRDWLSVVEFFVVEAALAAALALAVLWWMNPLVRGVIRLAEVLLHPLLPLETLLVGRRMRLAGRVLAFTLAGVTLVFSLLTGLHDITRALKHEIGNWSRQALDPYVFLKRTRWGTRDDAALEAVAAARGLHLLRLSPKVGGEVPIRLVAAADANAYLGERGRPLLGPGRVIASSTLAARFGIAAGDRMLIHTGDTEHRFLVTGVADDLGFFAEDGQYVDLKSWFLVTEGNPLFASLEPTLGDLAAVRTRDGRPVDLEAVTSLRPYYQLHREGRHSARWQQEEIDRDFLIFDFILALTLVLAAVGVSNSILIQVQARRRELAVLRTLGVDRAQTTRMLLVEGAVIGTVAALLALVLGHTLGAISVAFLDRFTLFDYELVPSPWAALGISLLAVASCCLAALYPALVANRISSAESLQYE